MKLWYNGRFSLGRSRCSDVNLIFIAKQGPSFFFVFFLRYFSKCAHNCLCSRSYCLPYVGRPRRVYLKWDCLRSRREYSIASPLNALDAPFHRLGMLLETAEICILERAVLTYERFLASPSRFLHLPARERVYERHYLDVNDNAPGILVLDSRSDQPAEATGMRTSRPHKLAPR